MLYPEVGNYKAYHHVFHELRNMTPKKPKTEMEIVIETEGDCEALFVVEPNDPDRYEAVLTYWDEWLGFKISPALVAKHSAAKIAAFALYEMTWWGLSNKEVKKRIRKITWTRDAFVDRIISLDRIDITGVEAYFNKYDKLVFKGDLSKRKNKLAMCAWLRKNHPKSGNPPQLNEEQTKVLLWESSRRGKRFLKLLSGRRKWETVYCGFISDTDNPS